MPRFPKLRIGALEDLARQLRFAPKETLRRQLERTEALAGEIEPGRTYPEDWLVFRVTGYRPAMEGGEAPAMLVGEALLGDLSALVERLSTGAGIAESEVEGGAYLSTAELAARWKVSTKTLERYRRMGLIARRTAGPRGRTRLAYPVAAVERFEGRRGGKVEAAGAYTRIEGDVRKEIVRRASAYRRRLGWSLNQAAKRLAGQFGRGHETVRQLLKRHDAGAARPVFGEKGPPSARERRLIDRAYWAAVEPAEIAARLGRSRAAVLRVVADERARRLRGVLTALPEGRGDAASAAAALKAASCTEGLGTPGAEDLLGFLGEARAVVTDTAAIERARVQGFHALAARARQAIAGLPVRGGRTSVLDRIETDLRWAARLKAELMRSQLPLLVRTIEAAVGRAAEEVRGPALLALVEESLGALAAAVDAFEPARGGRLAAAAGLAMSRGAARFARGHAAELGLTTPHHTPHARFRATSRLGAGVRVRDWTRRVAVWQEAGGRVWLEPRALALAGSGALTARERAVLERRFGWGPAAGTLQEVARALSMTPMVVARVERVALRHAMRAGSVK